MSNASAKNQIIRRNWRIQPMTLAIKIILLSSAGVSAAWAEDTVQANTTAIEITTPKEQTLETIVVRSEKQNRSLQKTIASAAVVSSKQIKDRNLLTLEDVIAQMANVTSNANGLDFSIRGMAQQGGLLGSGATDLVSIYLDNTLLTSPINSPKILSTWDLQQVEVLRGAQSTTQGRSAMGGIVSLQSKDPGNTFTGDARLAYGSFGTSEIAAAVTLPISDELSLRLSAEQQKSAKGYIVNETTGTKQATYEYNTYRGKLIFKPNAMPEFKATFNFSRIEGTEAEDYVADDAQHNPYDHKVFIFQDVYRDRDINSFNLKLDYALSDAINLSSITSYSNSHLFRTLARDNKPTVNRSISGDTIGVAKTQEFRLNYKEGAIDAVTGVYVANIESGIDQVTKSPVSIPPLAFNILTPWHSNDQLQNYAWFSNIDYDLTSQVTLHAGLRYDHESLDHVDHESNRRDRDLGQYNAYVDQQIASGSTDYSIADATEYNVWLPKLGVTYKWTPDVSTSFTFQKAYRGGGVSYDSNTFKTAAFRPENSENYELAFRSLWLDKKLSLNANIFHINWKDQQTQQESGLVENASRSEMNGAEIEARYTQIRNLEVWASLGYLDATYKNYTDSSGENFDGKSLAYTPKQSATVGVTQKFNNGVFYSANIQSRSSYYTDETNNIKLAGVGILNAKVGYKDPKGWQAYVYGNNLLNKDYVNFYLARKGAKVGQPLLMGGVVEYHW